MEGLDVIDPSFWKGRRVFVTGDTGFKGSWAAIWLTQLGAEVFGYALEPATEPSLFVQAKISGLVHHTTGDVRDLPSLQAALRGSRAEIVLHMAAQSLVRASYADPLGTFATNVIGTANLLEAVRGESSVLATVVVTSDKCYENRETAIPPARTPYRETDPMGGWDPYSASKGCAELVTSSYARSFFAGKGVASARAGNVIGGGDWSADRLVPDAVRAFARNERVVLRNPASTRPWQHVLEPVGAYLVLAERVVRGLGGGWNFGPDASDAWPVAKVIEALAKHWGPSAGWIQDESQNPHEAKTLALDTSKALTELGWKPRIGLTEALEWTARWYRSVGDGADARAATRADIERYEARA